MNKWQDKIVNFNDKEYVSIKDMCLYLKYGTTDKCKNWLNKNNFSVYKIKTITNPQNKQLGEVSAIIATDVDKAIEKRACYNNLEEIDAEEGICSFYISQLYLESAPNVIMLGHTHRSVEKRMKEYQSYQIKVLRIYQIPSARHEKTLIDMMCKDYKKISRESVDISSSELPLFLEKADKIISFL